MAEYLSLGQKLLSGAVIRRQGWGDQISDQPEWAALATTQYVRDPTTGLALPVGVANPVPSVPGNPITGTNFHIPYSGTGAGTASVQATERITLIMLFSTSAGTSTFQITGEAVVTVPASLGVGIEPEGLIVGKAVTFAGSVASWAVATLS